MCWLRSSVSLNCKPRPRLRWKMRSIPTSNMPLPPKSVKTRRKWIETQIDRYESVLAEHPTWTDVRVRYGMLLKLVGRWNDAAIAFEQAAIQNPSYVEAWMQLALAKREIGDTPAAMAALETAIQIKPDYADLHYRLGLIYCSEMEFDLAMERMEHAISLNRDNADFQRHLWIVLQGMQMTGRTRVSADQQDRTHELADQASSDPV